MPIHLAYAKGKKKESTNDQWLVEKKKAKENFTDGETCYSLMVVGTLLTQWYFKWLQVMGCIHLAVKTFRVSEHRVMLVLHSL